MNIHNIIEKINRENSFTEIKSVKRRFCANLYDKLLVIESILKELYPDTYSYSVLLGSLNNTFIVNKLDITILIPETIISNSKDLTHTIKDLFIRFQIVVRDDGSVYLDEIKGYRGTLSTIEYVNGYQHSHMHGFNSLSNDSNVYRRFCLGSSDFSTVIIELAEILNSTKDLTEDEHDYLYITFMNVLHHFSHESLEGTPYKYIKDLKTPSELITVYNLTELLSKQADIQTEVVKLFSNRYFDLTIQHKYNKSTGKYEVNDKSLLEHLIFYSLLEKCIEFNGQYYKNRGIYNFSSPNLNNRGTYFRGKFIPFKITEDLTLPKNIEKIIHPQIFKHAKRIYEGHLNTILLKDARFRRFDTINN